MNLSRLISHPLTAILAVIFGAPLAMKYFQQDGTWMAGLGVTFIVMGICKRAFDRGAEAKRQRDWQRRWDEM